MKLIHKYGLYYANALFIVMLLYTGTGLNNLNFYLFLFCLYLNMYFAFHRGIIFSLSKQDDFETFKKELIKKIAEKTYQEMNEKNEDEDSRLN